ncbi:MAG TPA: glycosyltransferase family A protein [Gemmatimonadaceae bacterium]|nr:glycosyltransferase family A protein [Gemmatimonadaceae bacterium]
MRTETPGPTNAGPRREDIVPSLVSVIIPAFNAERWLAETIASVRDQSYKRVEIIVSDDGSTDGTLPIARAAADIVVQGTGGGPGGARNGGMRVARGEYLQFLDADDLLAPDKIARQVAALFTSGGDVAWEAFDNLVPLPNGEFERAERVAPELGPDLEASLLTARGFIQIGALLVHRSRRTDTLWFPEGRDVVEDVRYMMELARAGCRFVSTETDEPGLLFRQHTGVRHSKRPVESFALACAANADWARANWESHGELSPVRRAALSEAYAFAARQLAAINEPAFHEIASRGMSVGPEFLQELPAHLRWLSMLVGYERAESLAVRWRRAKRLHDTLPVDRP